ncbi:MAG: hypothetical protein ACYCU8_06010 [Ferrimicrobium acidiphilum]
MAEPDAWIWRCLVCENWFEAGWELDEDGEGGQDVDLPAGSWGDGYEFCESCVDVLPPTMWFTIFEEENPNTIGFLLPFWRQDRLDQRKQSTHGPSSDAEQPT